MRRLKNDSINGLLQGYLYDSAMFLPMLISPLSIRRLNPQSGLLQTQAL